MCRKKGWIRWLLFLAALSTGLLLYSASQRRVSVKERHRVVRADKRRQMTEESRRKDAAIVSVDVLGTSRSPATNKASTRSPAYVPVPEPGSARSRDTMKRTVMKLRVELVKQMCAQMNLTTGPPDSPGTLDLQHILVDDSRRILFCYIPKVACTNFKRTFLYLTGVVDKSGFASVSGYDVHFTYFNRLRDLSTLSPREQQLRLKTYKKFMAVREPLERYLSGFKSKYHHPNPINRKKFSNDIVDFYKYYQEMGRKVKDINNISLSEVVQFTIDQARVNERLNEHFEPYWKLCRPCEIDYDYIAKYETLVPDVNYIFQELNIDVEFPTRADNFTQTWTREVAASAYTGVSQKLKSGLWELFRSDYSLFNYPKPPYI